MMHKHSRPQIVAFLIFAIAIVSGSAATWFAWPRTAVAPALREALTLGRPDVPHALPIILAEELGFFRDEGLDVTFRTYDSGRQAIAGMLNDEVEVATAADTPIVLASLRRRDFVVLASFMHTYADSKLIARADRGILNAAALRGHRVGVLAGTTSQHLLHSLLADNGLSLQDIAEVAIPPAEIAGRLASGDVDAIAVFEPLASRALMSLEKDQQIIIRSDRLWSSFNYVVRRDLPQRRAEALARLLRATDKSIAWARQHRPETIAIMTRRLGLDASTSGTILDEFKFALSLDQTLILSLEDLAQWSMRTGLASTGTLPNYLDFVDASVLSAVKPAAVRIIR